VKQRRENRFDSLAMAGVVPMGFVNETTRGISSYPSEMGRKQHILFKIQTKRIRLGSTFPITQ
jgi:predicted amino acid racemase